MRYSLKLSLGFCILSGILVFSAFLYARSLYGEDANEQLEKSLRLGFAVLFSAGVAGSIWFLFKMTGIIREAADLLAAEARRLILASEMSPLPAPDLELLRDAVDGINELTGFLTDNIDELKLQKQGYESVFNAMTQPVIAIDAKSRVTLANQAAVNFFSMPTFPVGKELSEVLRSSDIKQFIEHLPHAGIESVSAEIMFTGEKGGPPFYLILSGSALMNLKGENTGAVAVVSDITEIRKSERIQRDFVANVSHEIRTPLTVIQSVTESLQDGVLDDPAAAASFLDALHRNVTRLSLIIEDILSLSKVENMRESKHLESALFSVPEVINGAIRLCTSRAEARHTVLKTDMDSSLTMTGNSSLIEQCVMNLIDNALKYSDPGKTIVIGAKADAETIRISVTDQGYGIAAEHFVHLFDRFYRIDKGRSRQTGGTGLGLAIVRHIAHVHGGEVTVRSTPGTGSVFTLTFPRC